MTATTPAHEAADAAYRKGLRAVLRHTEPPGWMRGIPTEGLYDLSALEPWLADRGLPRPNLLELEVERARRVAIYGERRPERQQPQAHRRLRRPMGPRSATGREI